MRPFGKILAVALLVMELKLVLLLCSSRIIDPWIWAADAVFTRITKHEALRLKTFRKAPIEIEDKVSCVKCKVSKLSYALRFSPLTFLSAFQAELFNLVIKRRGTKSAYCLKCVNFCDESSFWDYEEELPLAHFKKLAEDFKLVLRKAPAGNMPGPRSSKRPLISFDDDESRDSAISTESASSSVASSRPAKVRRVLGPTASDDDSSRDSACSLASRASASGSSSAPAAAPRGRVWCDSCQEWVLGKPTLVKRHNNTDKHKRGIVQQPFPCQECPKQYARKEKLIEHINKKHPQ